jgi:hypothetical protein
MKKNQHHQNRSSSSCNKATNTADIIPTATSSRTEHDHSEQQQPSFSLFSFSLKRRYLFCCIMAISLLAIDLIRKNAILRVVQVMSTDNKQQQAVARGTVVVPFFQESHSVAAIATLENTTSITSSRHSRFPWRNGLRRQTRDLRTHWDVSRHRRLSMAADDGAQRKSQNSAPSVWIDREKALFRVAMDYVCPFPSFQNCLSIRVYQGRLL